MEVDASDDEHTKSPYSADEHMESPYSSSYPVCQMERSYYQKQVIPFQTAN